jgi:pimeloyl-ACP methyl ester carboxylesterase
MQPGGGAADTSERMLRRLPLILFVALALALVSLREFASVRPTATASFGRGSPIVLVHGLGSMPGHWLAAARELARTHRVTLVQLPGHGASDMPNPFSLDLAVQALDDALLQAGGEPVVLVGHSLGGLVAAAEAIAHPERVRALVLVETALRPQVAAADLPKMLRALDRNYASLVHAAYHDFGRDSAQGEALWQEVAALDRAMVKRWIRLAWTADLSEQAANLRVPVLVVLAPRSWDDGETWPEVAQSLGYERIPRAHPVRLTECGHFVMLDRPRELATLIGGFASHPSGEALRASRAAWDPNAFLAGMERPPAMVARRRMVKRFEREPESGDGVSGGTAPGPRAPAAAP